MNTKSSENVEGVHDLLPDSIASKIPPLYATLQEEDPIAHIRWFLPGTQWAWFVIEYSPDEQVCFGLIINHERETGFFSLGEIKSVTYTIATYVEIERDPSFEPKPISQCK